MRRRCFVLILLCPILAVSAGAAENLLDFAIPAGVKAGIVVTAEKTVPLTAATAFDVDADGVPTVADGAKLKQFGTARDLLALDTPRIDDFAFMRDGRLLLVTQDRIAGVSGNAVALSLKLPGPGMRVRPASDDTAYVFGGSNQAANRDVYLFARNGTITKLLSLPVAVASVAGDGRITYVAAERTVLRVAFNEPVRAVLQTREPVIAIEAGLAGSLFYATRSSVGYVDAAGRAFEFIRGEGGVLRRHGSQLFVLLASGTLLRLDQIEKFGAVLESPDTEIAEKADDEPIVSAPHMVEVAERLYELNFDPGRRDGGFDAATAAAIREFERTSGRADTGKATYGLLRALRAAGNRAPWGSIAFAPDVGKWGMGWGHKSRKAAVASAVASCGDPLHCESELSFYGSDCAAFAYSGKGWALNARNSSSAAREAALSECQRNNGTCRLVAAVCADGSNRSGAGP